MLYQRVFFINCELSTKKNLSIQKNQFYLKTSDKKFGSVLMDTELSETLELCFRVFKTLRMWQDGNQTWTYFFAAFSAHIFLIYSSFTCQLIYALNDILPVILMTFEIGLINELSLHLCDIGKEEKVETKIIEIR